MRIPNEWQNELIDCSKVLKQVRHIRLNLRQQFGPCENNYVGALVTRPIARRRRTCRRTARAPLVNWTNVLWLILLRFFIVRSNTD